MLSLVQEKKMGRGAAGLIGGVPWPITGEITGSRSRHSMALGGAGDAGRPGIKTNRQKKKCLLETFFFCLLRGERGRGFGGQLTSRNNVVDDQDLLARLDGTLLHLKVVDAVLLLVGDAHAGAGHLAPLADGHEAGIEAQGQRGAKQEAAGVQADDDVGLDAALEDLQLERAEEGEVGGGVLEQGEDVDELDALDGEVGEALERAEQLYLCTGEFGGGGGGGGGLPSRSILSCG